MIDIDVHTQVSMSREGESKQIHLAATEKQPSSRNARITHVPSRVGRRYQPCGSEILKSFEYEFFITWLWLELLFTFLIGKLFFFALDFVPDKTARTKTGSILGKKGGWFYLIDFLWSFFAVNSHRCWWSAGAQKFPYKCSWLSRMKEAITEAKLIAYLQCRKWQRVMRQPKDKIRNSNSFMSAIMP
jgi:hypothetical protein